MKRKNKKNKSKTKSNKINSDNTSNNENLNAEKSDNNSQSNKTSYKITQKNKKIETIEDHEIKDIENVIEKIILLDDNLKDSTYSLEDKDSIYVETMEDIKENFNDIQENKDNISNKGHLINLTLNVYENFYSTLNSKSNPFIKENKKIESNK